MKCLIVVPSLIRAGAETQAVDLANGLSASGHEVHLCCFDDELDQRSRLSSEVRFHHVRRNSKYDWDLTRRLAKVIDEHRIEVVQGVLLFACLVAWLATKRSHRKPPVVAAVHTTQNRGRKQEIQERLLYAHMLRRLPAVIFVCAHQRDHWIRKYPSLKSRARLVYNGMDAARFRREDWESAAGSLRATLDIPRDAIVFTCVAAFRPEKGHEILLEAFAKGPANAYLILAGDGERRAATETLGRARGLQGRLRFLGNVPDVRPAIVASNATVLASTAVETFSMAMLESMALGVPMIAPRIGGLSEAIVDRMNGRLIPVGGTEALAECFRDLAEDPRAWRQMGQAAHDAVVASFTLEQMVLSNEAVLRDVHERR